MIPEEAVSCLCYKHYGEPGEHVHRGSSRVARPEATQTAWEDSN